MPKEVYIIFGGLIAALASIFTTWLNPKLANIKDKKELKRKHNFDQLKELYLEIYGIIVQSEYLRYFIRNYSSQEDLSIHEYPFLEIVHTNNGQEIQNPITEFNKSEILKSILNNKKFASQNLLKLAVAYRYVHHHYQQNLIDKTLLHNYQEEELRLIGKIVVTIIKETNQMLDECNMEFNGKELSYGVMDLNIIEDRITYEHIR